MELEADKHGLGKWYQIPGTLVRSNRNPKYTLPVTGLPCTLYQCYVLPGTPSTSYSPSCVLVLYNLVMLLAAPACRCHLTMITHQVPLACKNQVLWYSTSRHKTIQYMYYRYMMYARAMVSHLSGVNNVSVCAYLFYSVVSNYIHSYFALL